jgi:hypothetical protein
MTRMPQLDPSPAAEGSGALPHTCFYGRYRMRPFRIHKAAFDELDPSGDRIVADPQLLEGGNLLQLSLGHIAGEETRFEYADR